jgi:hypothetical protein
MTVAFASFSGFQHSAGKPVLLYCKASLVYQVKISSKIFARLVKHSHTKLLAVIAFTGELIQFNL